MVSPADRSPYAIELNERQSFRLVERAVNAAARISLLPQTRPDDRPFETRIVGHSERSLAIRLQDGVNTDLPSLVSVYCEASLWLDAARFLFSTHVMDVGHIAGGVQFEIARPTSLSVIQRRRYQRRDLRGRTQVSILPADRDGQPPLEGTLLNVSTGGLACRIDRAHADLCCRDSIVQLEFSIADCEESFNMPARVRGNIPGAASGQVILSLEFTPGAVAEREKLADALYFNLAAITGG